MDAWTVKDIGEYLDANGLRVVQLDGRLSLAGGNRENAAAVAEVLPHLKARRSEIESVLAAAVEDYTPTAADDYASHPGPRVLSPAEAKLERAETIRVIAARAASAGRVVWILDGPAPLIYRSILPPHASHACVYGDAEWTALPGTLAKPVAEKPKKSKYVPKWIKARGG